MSAETPSAVSQFLSVSEHRRSGGLTAGRAPWLGSHSHGMGSVAARRSARQVARR